MESTILFGDTGGGADTNLAFAGNVALSGCRVIVEGAGDDSLALDWNQFSTDANTLALYHLNEDAWNGTPNEIIDSSGNDYHGRAVGACGTSTEWLNRFGRFAPADFNTYADFPVPTDVLSAFTMECWVRMIYKTSGEGNSGNAYGPKNGAQGLRPEGGPGPQFRIYNEAGAEARPRAGWRLSLDTWYQLRAVWDGSQVHLYVNGILEDSRNLTGTVRLDTEPWAWRDLTMGYGSEYYGDWGQWDVDEVRMSDVARCAGAFSPHRYEQGNAVIQYDFTAQQKLTNIAWNATEADDWEGDIYQIWVYDQDLSDWVQKGGNSPTSPIDLSGSPVTIGGVSTEDIIKIVENPKSDALQSETPKLLDMTLTHESLAAGFYEPRRFNRRMIMPGMNPGFMVL